MEGILFILLYVQATANEITGEKKWDIIDLTGDTSREEHEEERSYDDIDRWAQIITVSLKGINCRFELRLSQVKLYYIHYSNF